jgi:hypothetical protein
MSEFQSPDVLFRHQSFFTPESEEEKQATKSRGFWA